jgi:uncharacterized membrane protein YhaH (DUF805 family)
MQTNDGGLIRGEARPELGELFAHSSGRMARLPFLAVMAVLIGLFWLYDLHAQGAARAATGWLVDLLLLFSAACALSKRLHDRGRAGWWAGLALIGFALAWPAPRGLLGSAGLALVLAFTVDLALLPGQPRFNRFGPPA